MPAAQLGLAFVGWTRATEWSKVAFQSLPPFDHFLAMRKQPAFKQMCAFETEADSLHDGVLASRGLDVSQHVRAHRDHFAAQVREKQQREPTAHELQDLEHMLSQRGVAPVPDSVMAWARHQSGASSSMGLTQLVEAFRRDRKLRDAGDKAKPKASLNTRPKRENMDWVSLSSHVAAEILKDMKFPPAHIQEALEVCGPNVQACLDHCLALTHNGKSTPVSDNVVREEASAASALHSLGFDLQTVARALEACDFSFAAAIRLLLYGSDLDRAQFLDKVRFRRHTRRQAKDCDRELAASAVRDQYKARALAGLNLQQVSVLDFGQSAGKTRNACFWLCLAAGLASTAWSPPDGQALPADLVQLLAGTRILDLHSLNNADNQLIKDSPLGQLAAALRHHFCAGPSAVLTRSDVMARIFQAFAGVADNGPVRTLQMYKTWVRRLAVDEFADELVVVAVACELKIRIVCIPFTPDSAGMPWSISTYYASAVRAPNDCIIYLGNNDVHYMWLDSKPQ